MASPRDVAQAITRLYRTNGATAYDVNTGDSEPVTERDHAEQTAAIAQELPTEDLGYGREEFTAAFLLHDIGHALAGNLEAVKTLGGNDQHEGAGFRFLNPLFGPRVAMPCFLHCRAKRYLVTTRPDFRATLSPVSQKSFVVQGGLMDEREKAEFITDPYSAVTLRLRENEERAKEVGRHVPAIESYEPLLSRLMERHPANADSDRYARALTIIDRAIAARR